VDEALDILDLAMRKGLSDMTLLLIDPDLEPERDTRFRRLVAP